MQNFEIWIFSVLASSAGSAALIAIAAYLGRAQLSHWLNKDLEEKKAAHQRDLETYKVSLIAEAEKVKASRDVQKAMAVRIAEKKFSAIDDLHKKLASRAAATLATLKVDAASDHASRVEQSRIQGDRTYAASTAASLASPFMTAQENALVAEFVAALSNAAMKLGEPKFALTADEYSALKRKLLEMQKTCDAILESHISRMLDMN